MNNTKQVLELKIDDILPNRFQPRIKFDEEEINNLAASIKEHGVIQPIIVRPIGDKFEIIAGERRYKASVIAEKVTIPAIIMNLDDKKSAEIALIENVQRQDLTPIEEAISYRKILDMGYLTQEELAKKVDCNQSTIANKLRLLNLDDVVQQALLNEEISERHARSLLKVEDKNKQCDMLNKIINERLTVRRTDEEISKVLNNSNNIKENKMEENLKNSNIFNIPSDPIIENIDNEIFNEDELNNKNIDTIDKESKEAKEINVEKPMADLDDLLEQNKNQNDTLLNNYNEELNDDNNDDDNNDDDNFVLRPGKFFNINNEIPEENFTTNNEPAVFSENLFGNDKSLEKEKETNNLTINDDQNINAIDFENLLKSNKEDFEDMKKNSDFIMESNQNLLDQDMPDNKIEEDVFNKDMFDNIKNKNINGGTTSYVTGDLKTVINTIRNCASTIEKYGYIIDTEELDFEDSYQVIFKIQKKK